MPTAEPLTAPGLLLFNNGVQIGVSTGINLPFRSTAAFDVEIEGAHRIVEVKYDASSDKIIMAYNGVVDWTNATCTGMPALLHRKDCRV